MIRRILPLLFFAGALWAKRDVVSLSTPLTETIYLLGQQERLAMVSDTSLFPAAVVDDRKAGKVTTVAFMNPDMAAIDAVHPSLILTSTSFQRPLAEKLRARGFKVMHFEPQSISDILNQIEQLGEALGKGPEAGRIAQAMREELTEIERKTAALPKVRVYMEINHMGPWTSGNKTPENEIIRLAGGENIFREKAEGAFTTTNAEVVRLNPEIILSPIWLDAKVGGIDGITTLVEIMTRPGYAETAAVKNGRVLYFDSALFKQQGPRDVLAVRKLAYLLHPEAFENPPDTIPWELGRVRQ